MSRTPSSSNAGCQVAELRLSSGRSVRIGCLICFDIEFPEPARVLRLLGAEVGGDQAWPDRPPTAVGPAADFLPWAGPQILIVPTALAVGPADRVTPYCTINSRAAENGVFILYSNFCAKGVEVGGCPRVTLVWLRGCWA
jgi:predicted amidohydrolase